MSRLFLLRHAKAQWAEPGQRDFDRALEPVGVEEARAIGAAMAARDLWPERVVCSTAARARQTLDGVNAVHDLSPVTRYSQDLYATDAPGYLEVVAGAGFDGDFMLVGHNPMLEEVALALASTGDDDAIGALRMGFRTAGLVVIGLDGPLAHVETMKGRLEAYLTPDDGRT